MAAYEVLLLNTAIPQIQAAQSGDTYVVPRDIAFSAALTLSAGTANGVPYLNGSKVLTSGSALTYNGTGLGVGSANPGRLLVLDGGASGPTLQMTNTAAGSSAGNGFELTFDGTNTFLNNRPNGYMWFGVNATEGMRLTTTGLGIGTSSPAYKLDVSRSTTGAVARFANSSAWSQILIESGGSNQNAYLNFSPTGTGKAIFQIGISDYMFLDSAGNFGVGVASPSTYGVMSVASSASQPVAHINAMTGSAYNTPYTASVYIGGFRTDNVNNGVVVGYRLKSYGADATTGAVLSFETASSATGSSNPPNVFTERARITSGGDFRVKGAGTAGSTDAFQISGSAPADAARITSGGKFLVGQTALNINANNIAEFQGSCGIGLRSVGGAAFSGLQVWNDAASGDNLLVEFLTDAGGAVRGTIDYNRAGGQVRYNTTSDYRAKEVYGTVQDSGAQIDALKIYRGKMLGATQERPMMIAHEAQEVVPYAVGGEKDAVNEDGTPKYQTMDHQILVPLLIAELQSLRARVAQLEGK